MSVLSMQESVEKKLEVLKLLKKSACLDSRVTTHLIPDVCDAASTLSNEKKRSFVNVCS